MLSTHGRGCDYGIRSAHGLVRAPFAQAKSIVCCAVRRCAWCCVAAVRAHSAVGHVISATSAPTHIDPPPPTTCILQFLSSPALTLAFPSYSAPQHLQQMKADMQAAQQRMVQDFQQQRLLAGGGPAPPGAAGGANTQQLPGGLPPGFLPPDFDPSSLPPGFDMRNMAQADPQAHAALMALMAQAQGGGAGGMGGGGGAMGPAGMGGMGGMGGMFGGR